MHIGYGLRLEQTQKLIMTPELRQAITVLQLSSLELGKYIEQQLQENPVLELMEESDGVGQSDHTDIDDQNSKDREYDIDWQEYFQDSSDLGILKLKRAPEQVEYTYENYLSQAPTLIEHLMFQLSISRCKESEKIIGEYLIGNIDNNGYLQTTIEEVSMHFSVMLQEVERVLAVIQTFDPVGVGSRNLEECLLIQVEHSGKKDNLLVQVIRNHLEDLARGRIGRMAQVLGITTYEVQRVADLIKTFDPKPGRNFRNPNDVRYIVPDVVLEKVGGEYIILVNDILTPRLVINSKYRSVLKKDIYSDDKTRRFVESKLNAAAWLLRSIEQRRNTLYKVVSCLVALQRDYLDKGVKYLKPLILKDVAEIVGIHESTVSRATSNKYIQTPQGILEMKCFFSTALYNSAGSATSAECIKKIIHEIVFREDVRNPYNDQKIVDILKQRDINISRRTIAKYREELGIPPIRKRKRY